MRNARETLAEALGSVLRQTFRAFECIIVDDGSTDDTATIARRFERADPRFRVLQTPALGLVSALTSGIASASAPWVARMDADDLMLRRRLELQLALLTSEPSLIGAGTHVRMFPRAALTDGRLQYERWLNSVRSVADVFREKFVECPLAHPTWMIKTEVLRDFGYREHRGPEDYDLLLRLLTADLPLGVVPKRLVLWRDHPARLSRVDVRYAQVSFTWLKALHLSQSFLLGQSSYVLWGYGATAKALSGELRRRGHHASHIVEVHPGRLGQTIHGAPVIPPEALRQLRSEPLVVSVAGGLARRQIRTALRKLGYLEPRDFVCAA